MFSLIARFIYFKIKLSRVGAHGVGWEIIQRSYMIIVSYNITYIITLHKKYSSLI